MLRLGGTFRSPSISKTSERFPYLPWNSRKAEVSAFFVRPPVSGWVIILTRILAAIPADVKLYSRKLEARLALHILPMIATYRRSFSTYVNWCVCLLSGTTGWHLVDGMETYHLGDLQCPSSPGRYLPLSPTWTTCLKVLYLTVLVLSSKVDTQTFIWLTTQWTVSFWPFNARSRWGYTYVDAPSGVLDLDNPVSCSRL